MEENVQAPTTREVGLQYGAILGVVSIVLFLIPSVMAMNPFKSPWNWIGAAASVAAIILAHKKYKDEGDSFMSYRQGLLIAFWIGLISSVISIAFSYGYTVLLDNGPFELFMVQQEDEMIAKNVPDNMIETSLEWTRKLFWVIGLVMSVIFTLLEALVITAFTKRINPDTQL